MKRKVQPLASRVAKLQIWVTAGTLLAVTLATAVAVSLLLAQKTDQQLESVLARVAYYVREKPALDVTWLAGEVEEVRPIDARVELLDASGALRFSQGDGARLGAAPLGCSSQGRLRICVKEERGLRVAVGKSRDGDAVMLRGIVGILALLSLAATLVVAILSRGVTAQAIDPLSQLTTKVTALEPGAVSASD